MTTWVCDYRFRDRDGNEAQTRLHVGENVPFDVARTTAISWGLSLSQLSDAILTRVNISRITEYPDAAPAGPLSDCTRLGCVVVALENGFWSVVLVPSVRTDLTLTDEQGKNIYVLDESLEPVSAFYDVLIGTKDDTGSTVTGVVIGGIAN